MNRNHENLMRGVSASPSIGKRESPHPLGTNQIILVNPSNTVRERQTTFVRAIYPNLGLITLGTSLQNALKRLGSSVKVLYFDGALHADDWFYHYLDEHAQDVFALCFSSYTYNYGECVRLAAYAKQRNPRIATLIGNDHFSALYEEVLRRREGIFDYGFYGNDVVEGFTQFMIDMLAGNVKDLSIYPGLVYRDPANADDIKRNAEDSTEYVRLPLVDYSLIDSLIPHSEQYHQEQVMNYRYIREGGLRVTVIDIARGCMKFAGTRTENGIPRNACSFCAIIPGSKALLPQRAERAWDIIHNAFDQGYNYFFTSADELPSTFWPMLEKMVQIKPAWYRDLPRGDRPKILCYARADGFRENTVYRLDLLMNELGFDHFNLGMDAFTQISLRAMNKGINTYANDNSDLPRQNMMACEEISKRGGKITSGIVVTHLGITPEIMESNYQILRSMVESRRHLFIEIGFELLCPLPGSHSFEEMRNPKLARAHADSLGLQVNDRYLESVHSRYRGEDLFDAEDLVQDFIKGCCPGISLELAYEYLGKYRELVEQHEITWESTSPV